MSKTDINQEMLSFVEVSGQAMKVALEAADRQDAAEKAASDKIESVVSALKKATLIDANDEVEIKKASAQLTDHGTALDILVNVVDHYEGQQKEAQAKQASANLGGADTDDGQPKMDKYANYVGRRRGIDDGPAESDKALLGLIGR